MSETKEKKFITDRLNTNPPSNDLLEMRKAVAGNIPSENIIEFFIKPDELEELKSSIKKETKGNCYFFTKVLDNEVSVICFYDIKGIAEVFDQEKERLGLDKGVDMSFSDFKKSVSLADKPYSFLDD